MSLSHSLWQKLPQGFLKKKYSGWCRLDLEVQRLIVKRAEKQNYKCAFCDEACNLIVEHDHYPNQGDGDRPTIYNIRGLACHRHNWHLGIYEADNGGEYRAWDHVESCIWSHSYERYIGKYEWRVECLREAELKDQLGELNYYYRIHLLQKFDDWKYEGAKYYPWYWGFEEIKVKRHGNIRTPMQFLRTLLSCMRFVAEKVKKDANYRPPAQLVEVIVKVEPIIREAMVARGMNVPWEPWLPNAMKI
jgi:hypothetical protein